MAGRGRFITLEGGEGAGKSTLARRLAEELTRRGIEVDVTREPGGTDNAEAIRELLVTGDTRRWSALSETLLFHAARVDHLENRIRPALERGVWVICDRFADSTRAYQGAAGKLERARLDALHEAVLGEFEPDLTLILDLDPQIGLERARERGEAVTRFEKHDLAFHRALREGFLEIAREEPERCAVIDAARDAETIAAEALAIIDRRLKG
ncbi:dTMP kinase [Marinicauda algicola]|uniref:Thymidylate kinase n=1 Tax=Marinicauda algicola TaxID=2029849 RepID=A0A4S2GXZ3_9PROT|nr:dTMP kinase [Marinicauda algicola]TGY87923.1 dTMP kinase [Marinicauda algicola]